MTLSRYDRWKLMSPEDVPECDDEDDGPDPDDLRDAQRDLEFAEDPDWED